MEFFEGDIKLVLGQIPYIDKKVKREAGGSGEGVVLTQEPSDEKGFKSRDDLWEEGKVPYKFETSLSTLKKHSFC